MFVAVAPVVFNFDKGLVNSAIMQLELENETKDGAKDSGKLYTVNNLICGYARANFSVNQLFMPFHRYSKKYLNVYYPSIPTPPPNRA